MQNIFPYLAPSTGHPVTVTVGTVWRLQLVPPPPRPPRLSGLMYFQDCPQQPNIPKYLLGIGLFPLPDDFGFWACLCVVWVFSVYQPNYDPSAADGLYCNKNLYTFAFWNVVLETFAFVILLAQLCKGLLCYVNMSPVDTDFYRNV
ncbi:LOW QUALITY PROTEIN: uncharacterized protein FYW61_019655 [Anableps anableps]